MYACSRWFFIFTFVYMWTVQKMCVMELLPWMASGPRHPHVYLTITLNRFLYVHHDGGVPRTKCIYRICGTKANSRTGNELILRAKQSSKKTTAQKPAHHNHNIQIHEFMSTMSWACVCVLKFMGIVWYTQHQRIEACEMWTRYRHHLFKQVIGTDYVSRHFQHLYVYRSSFEGWGMLEWRNTQHFSHHLSSSSLCVCLFRSL